MKNNKLINLLAALPKIEIKQFRKYLISPFFNENQSLVQLFDYLVHTHIANANARKLDKKVIWEHLFENKPYKDVKMRRLFSDLNQLLNGFLAYQQYEANAVQRSYQLMHSLQYTNLDKQFDGAFRQANFLQ